MSQVYSTEPATTGRVVFDTTHGPIDINLWCKECPTTTRTFLQLCLDSYYDGMIFHRILSDFLIQTGLTRDESLVGKTPAAKIDSYLRQSSAVPSSSSGGMSGDALGLDRKKLEVNPRIRFNHRGQLAMAFPLEQSSDDTSNEEDSAMLRYQFFVTLDEAPFLDAKHVLFGTVVGSTMFNALRIGRTDADEQTGIPTDMKDAPPRIKSVKVDYHPFEDLVVTADKKIPYKDVTNTGGPAKDGKQSTMEKRRKKRKGKRDLNVLSFGDEERDYDDITSKGDGGKGGGGSMLSSHDVLSSESNFLSSKVDADVGKRSKEKDDKKKKARSGDHSNQVSLKMELSSHENNNTAGTKAPPREIHNMHEKNGALDTINKGDSNEEDRHNDKPMKSTKPKSIGAVEARRAKYLKSGSGSSANKNERLKREGDTMAKLFAFKNKVLETKGSTKSGKDSNGKKHTADDSLASRMAKRVKQAEDDEELRNKEQEAFVSMPGYSGQVNDEGTDAVGDWMGTKFKCKRHIDQDARLTALDKIDVEDVGGDGRRMDDYVVLDEKRSGRGDRNGQKKQSHRGHHEQQHSGRSHKSHGGSYR